MNLYYILLLSFVLLLTVSICSAFNIDDKRHTENVLIGSKQTNAFIPNHNISKNATFFGYQIFYQRLQIKGEEVIRFMVGAPLKMVQAYKGTRKEEDFVSKEPSPQKRNALIPTPAMGVNYLCELKQSQLRNRTLEGVHNCTDFANIDRSLVSGDISDRDGLGMTLGSRNISDTGFKITETNEIVACAPLRMRDCGLSIKAEGACYVSMNGPSRGDTQTVTTWVKKSPCTKSCIRRNIDLMYVIDGSFSVGLENFFKVKAWIKNVTKGFDLSDKVQVGVVQYSYYNASRPTDRRYLKTEIELGQYKDLKKFDEAIDKIKYQGYQTFTANAIIKTVKEDFNSANSRYPDARRVMILLTDGKADDKSMLPNATHYAEENGVEGFAIGIGKYDHDELVTIAGDPERVLTVENFEDLSDIVSRLQKDIQVLEGSSTSNQSNGLSQCQAGFSSKFKKSGRLYLGAVGAWDWSGTIVKYDSPEDTEPDIPDLNEVKKVLVNWTKESYLGYSLTSGYYNGEGVGEYVAIGAPRYKLEGAVVIYLPQTNSSEFTNASTIYPNPNNMQLGSYFGGALLSADLNGDGYDDLIIGAPLYIGANYDDGRVYVYVTKGTNNVKKWAEPDYVPIVLEGNAAGGRFGSAMAFAGDLNKDNFSDIIVGAPYSDNTQGSVYIFHGSANGIDPNPRQVIQASSLPNDNLRYFGLSIQGGQDLDGNGYPDVVVGAPKSDSVIIFRSRPVVRFSGTLRFSSAKINITSCILAKGKNCIDIEVCLVANGENIEEHLLVNSNLTLDTRFIPREQKRIEFQSGRFLITNKLNLTRGQQECTTYNVTVKDQISDYSTPIEAKFEFKLASSHTNKTLSSLPDPNENDTFVASTSFDRDCGDDNECIYNLGVNGTLVIPPVLLTGIGDLTNKGKVVIVSQDSTLFTVKVNLTNTGDVAFDVRVALIYNDKLGWDLRENRTVSSNPGFPCIEDENTDTVQNPYRYKTLVYKYSSLLGSIMRKNQWCYFEFDLSTIGLRDENLPNINVTVYAFTSNGKDSNASNNRWNAMNPIRYRTDVEVNDRSIEYTVPFNFTGESETITSVTEIGKGLQPILFRFSIEGKGYSNIPTSNIAFTFPFSMRDNDTQHLLYLYDYSCRDISAGNTECICDDEGIVNPYNLLTPEETAEGVEGKNFTIEANSEIIDSPRVYNCFAGNTNSVECRTLNCRITNLGSTDTVEFLASFRLWTNSLNLTDNANVTLVSNFAFNTQNSSLLINDQGGSVINRSEQVNTYARLFTAPPVVAETNTTWIYIVAALGGIALLAIIIAVLWKTGFFKSKYAEKKEKMEWTDPNTSGDSSGSMGEMEKS